MVLSRIKKVTFVFTGLLICVGFIAIILFTKPHQHFDTIHDYYNARYTGIHCSGMADFLQYDYSNLFRYAHTVAVVTPLDELSTENTFGISGKDDPYYNIHSVREVKVLEYFKNEQEYGDTFEIAEECGVLEDGTLVMLEDCWPMQKGDTYLVFLCKSGFGYPLSISACNGKFDLTHLDLNCRQHSLVLLNALLELNLLTEDSIHRVGVALQETTEIYFFYQPEDDKHITRDDFIKWESYRLYTRWTDKHYSLTIKCGTDEEGTVYSYRP